MLSSVLCIQDCANESLLCEMMRGFPLFSDLIRNVELAMSKADLTIARLYAELVPDAGLRERVWDMLVDEFERTRRMLLSITRPRGTAEGESSAGPLDPLAQSLRGPDEPGAGRTFAAQTRGWKSGRRGLRAGRYNQRYCGGPAQYGLSVVILSGVAAAQGGPPSCSTGSAWNETACPLWTRRQAAKSRSTPTSPFACAWVISAQDDRF